ncbi:L-fuculokinase [Vibrio sp. 10N.222.54.A1]|jgi:L-fuculokinase|uniref:L-fuculokinase n=1 Tax=Vibrio TaxID=662 RepID=UPI0002DFDF0F|nr:MULTISPECIES: L-fuculokinase [Vibrio]ANP77808.1 L-fuculokinase [Vibrio crassostreae 9CS106]MCC4889224.1 L-fuculokinase [Vibrio sp. F13]OCH56510.1 L-fuculokinase [Vibrio sp. ZF57]PMK07575.1 L-fuculokinase [Vibrio sp. 10N.261.54.E10]PMK81230.1 L-fuculokinase [Vibrio sp. 10N.261.52.E5]
MSIAIILDCGATNVRSIAINQQGEIVASHYIANETLQNGTKHVWDFQQIWKKLVECSKQVTAQINSTDIVAVSVTTFGVDGAPFDKDGKQIYPIISWKCARTAPVMSQISQDIDRDELYLTNGIGDYSFNTLFKLKWLKDNEPKVYSNMDKWVFISSMLTQKLTGELTTDRTMAGTSMMTDLDSGDWNEGVLQYLELTKAHFPPMVEAGEIVGCLKDDVAFLLGIPNRVPVISAGHDTQFALFGSGAKENQSFLSSGTWEILMARSPRPQLKPDYLKEGMTTELDAKNDLFNPAIQWLSSAVMEWVANTYFTDIAESSSKYAVMVSEGEAAPIGANGVRFDPSFLLGGDGKGNGAITGLSINATRGEIYRAALEGLAFKLKSSLHYLSTTCRLNTECLMVVGGGSKNRLWNQIRADVVGIPIHVVEQPEATVTGAAMYAFAGAGVFIDANHAQENMKPAYQVITPSESREQYAQLLEEIHNA